MMAAMSDEILYDLYWGEVRPGEKIPDKPERIRQLEARFRTGMLEIAEAAGEAAVERLDDLLSVRNEIESYYGSVDFVRGFKLGVKFMVAVFKDDLKDGSSDG